MTSRDAIAHEAGRARGDEVCRVPGADRDAALAALHEQTVTAATDVVDLRAALAHAHGKHSRLLERLADGDIEPREEKP